jgi:hypothetical protein
VTDASIPRSHHYVPEFYLAGFTPSGSKEDFLWVRDFEQQKEWRCRPRNVAAERDFFRVEQEGVPPEALEKTFGIIEGRAAPALQRIASGENPPGGEDLQVALQFVAMLAMRVPSGREIIDRNIAHMGKFMMRFVAGHPSYFAQSIEEMKQAGKLADDVDAEKLRAFILDDSKYTTSVVPSSTLGLMVEMIDELPPVLAARKWSLVVANDDAPDFITTDRPVALAATSPDAPRHLGFGLTCTEVSLPLNRRVSLVGHFDGEAQVVRADSILVGLYNQRMLDLAGRFVFSAAKEIVVSVPRDDQAAAQPP